MSKEWEVTGKRTETGETILNLVTVGLKPIIEDIFGIKENSIYTVKNKETGEEREVTARDETELGGKISRGEFGKIR